MKKQDQIDELKAQLTKALFERDLAKTSLANEQARREQEEDAAEAKATQEATEAALRQIRGGSIPIKVLRDAIVPHYEVTNQGFGNVTNFRLCASDRKPLEKALVEALLAPEKPKFATGGYVSGGPTLVGDTSPTDYFRVPVGDPFPRYHPYVPGGNYYFNGGKAA